MYPELIVKNNRYCMVFVAVRHGGVGV